MEATPISLYIPGVVEAVPYLRKHDHHLGFILLQEHRTRIAQHVPNVSLVNGLEQALHLLTVLAAADEPVGGAVFMIDDGIELFFAEIGLPLAVEYFKVIPVLDLSV